MTFYGQGLDRLRGQFAHIHELGPETQALLSHLIERLIQASQKPDWQQPPDLPSDPWQSPEEPS